MRVERSIMNLAAQPNVENVPGQKADGFQRTLSEAQNNTSTRHETTRNETARTQNTTREAARPEQRERATQRDSTEGMLQDTSGQNINQEEETTSDMAANLEEVCNLIPQEDSVDNILSLVGELVHTTDQPLTDNYELPSSHVDYTRAMPLVESVAEVLDLPPAQVLQTLSEEGITPEDLQQPSGQQKLIQAVHQADSPADLLEITDIDATFQHVDNAVKEGLQTMAKQEEHVLQAITQGEVSTSNEVITTLEAGTGQPEEDQSFAQNQEMPQENQVANQVVTEQPLAENVVVNGVTQVVSTPAPVATTTLAPPKQATPTEIMDQIKGQIKVNLKGTVSEIRMILNPENLGEVSLKIMTQNGIITAQFTATNHRVKEIIEGSFNELKEELTNQGIEVSELSVSVRQENSHMESFLREQEKSQHRVSTIIKNIMEETEEETEEIQIEGSSVSYTA